MERLCHVFRIAPGTEDEYVRRHVEIWPELVEAMKASGFANYTLFRRGLEVIAVCECHPDVATCFARFAEHGAGESSAGESGAGESGAGESGAGEGDVGERWQAFMAGIVLDQTDENGELRRYDEDWHLD
jgi:L-rhamnose mutarotase